MSDQGINYEIWTPPNAGSFVRKHDITAWVLPGTSWDVRLKELPAGQLIVHRDCPHLDDILYEDRADHTNDVGSTLMMFRDGVWLGAMVPTSRDDDVSSEDAPVTFGLEGLEWYLDKARVEPYDHPADPIREGDWIYGHPTILTPAGGEVTDTQYQLSIDGASSGTFKITDGTSTTNTISWDENDPSVIKTRLETDIAAINEVVVSGNGTVEFEFIIFVRDPAATDITLTVTDDTTNGTVALEKIQTGGNLSPRPWHGTIAGTTGILVGNYQGFDLVEAGVGSTPSAPAGSSSTHLLKIDAGAPSSSGDYAGGQVELGVIWGHRYWGEIDVYSETTQRIRFIIRDMSENEIEADDQTVTADTWTTLDLADVIPTGVDTVAYRVGVIVEDDATPIYLDVNEAVFAPGVPAAPFGEITNDLLAPIQSRSVLDWITETFSDTQDSTSEAWDRDLAGRVRRGQTFYQWLEYGSRWGYERSIRWDGTNWDFGLYNPGNLGTDYTGQGGPTVSPFDGGVGSSPYIQRVPDFTTAIAEGDAGTWGEYTDADLATGWGRLEGYFANRQNVGDDLDSLAQQMVTDTTDESVSHRQAVQNPTVLPLTDVLVGDTVPVLVRKPDGTVVPEMMRCVMIAVEETDTLPIYTYHFGSSVFDAEEATQEALRSLIRRYQALDEIGDGGGTVEPLSISSPVPSTATDATAGSLKSGARESANNGGTTHDWLVPSNFVAGDRLYLAIMLLDNATGTTIDSIPSGWDTLITQAEAFDGVHHYLFTKVADGTETDTTVTTSGSTRSVSIAWPRSGPTGTPVLSSMGTDSPFDDGVGVGEIDPPPVSVPAAGLYAVDVLVFGNFGVPQTDEDAAAPDGYETIAYNYSELAGRRPHLWIAQGAFNVDTSEDPGGVSWTDVDGQFRTWTVATRLDTGSAPVAAGDHTHSGLVTGGDSHDHSGGDGAQIDHGGLAGLADDDHTQYVKADGTRAFTGTVSGVTPTADAHLATKGYVDAAGGGGSTVVSGPEVVSGGALRYVWGVDSSGRPTYTAAGTSESPAIVVFENDRYLAREV